MDTQTLLLCLEQRVLLMEKIHHITQEMDALSREEEGYLDDLLKERGTAMGRIDKSSKLISSYLSGLPEEERRHWNALLGGKDSLLNGSMAADEKRALELSREYGIHLASAAALDKPVFARVEKRRGQLQQKLNTIRGSRPGNRNSLFL